MSLLILNSGSSSLKYALYPDAEQGRAALLRGKVENLGQAPGQRSLEEAFREVAARVDARVGKLPTALGHRVVHGGPHLREHRELTDEVLQTLEDARPFAPLHLPPALALIRAARERYPGARQFVCLDTVFHQTLPEEASVLPVPREYRVQGVRRYGFHGLSYESIVEQLSPQVPERTVVAHLGSGSSLAALRHGVSVDTSMGLTPTGGIPMGTRTGDLDPGVPLWLMRTQRLDADALDARLNHDSGLAALSGGTSDMLALTRAAEAGDAAAALAIAVFVRSIVKTVGAYAALLGGLELLVFTGGIGERSPLVRQRVCASLGFLGVVFDAEGNQRGQERLTPAASRCQVRVLATNEEGRIAHHTRRLLHGDVSRGPG